MATATVKTPMQAYFQPVINTEEGIAASLAELFIDSIPKRIHSTEPQSPIEALAENDIKVLLLENASQESIKIFNQEGYQVEWYNNSFTEAELISIIGDVHILGIGPKTELSANILKHAKNLMAIGCFCMGVGNVDIEYAASMGIAVFHSPFSNSRSVAELVIGNIINLSRQICDRSQELHNGIWKTSYKNCWEIRGKVLGIIGYGHIGSQVSILAESIGMNVIYYDVQTVMSLGAAQQVSTLNSLLKNSDFVTLHVPENSETFKLIGKAQFDVMKTGSYIINTSRGSVIDMDALIEAIESNKILGAALDVYPYEPLKDTEHISHNQLSKWLNKLSNLPNVILTPHIGGSTEEAQEIIGKEVSESLINYVNEGNSVGAVNFPQIELKSKPYNIKAIERYMGHNKNLVRILYVHNNKPGVLKMINGILWEHNIEKQYYESTNSISYLITDVVTSGHSEIMHIYEQLEATSEKLLVRLLYY